MRNTSSRSRSSGATSGSTSQARSAAAAPAATPSATPSIPPLSATGVNLPSTPLSSGAAPALGNLTNLQQILSGIQVPESALSGLAAGAQGHAEKPSGRSGFKFYYTHFQFLMMYLFEQ